jgi:hypothetical protein
MLETKVKRMRKQSTEASIKHHAVQFLLVLHFTINGVMVCFSAAKPIFGLRPQSRLQS